MIDNLDDTYIEELTDDIPDVDDISFDIKPRRKRRSREEKAEQEKELYLNKTEMWEALRDYYIASDKDPDMMIPIKLATMINDIIDGMASRPNFNGYSWIDDMVGDAKEKCFKAVRNKTFKLTKTAEIVEMVKKKDDMGNEQTTVFYKNVRKKKDVIDSRIIEPQDILFDKEGKQYITFNQNPFGFYSTTVFNCCINRIKKEKTINQTKHEYQSEIYEQMYASEAWRNVRRQKILYGDDATPGGDE